MNIHNLQRSYQGKWNNYVCVIHKLVMGENIPVILLTKVHKTLMLLF